MLSCYDISPAYGSAPIGIVLKLEKDSSLAQVKGHGTAKIEDQEAKQEGH